MIKTVVSPYFPGRDNFDKKEVKYGIKGYGKK